VLRAATVGNGGEILVLDMGSPTRMIDMVEDMIALAGLRPHGDTRVQFVGLRPGEKLLKELSIHDELPVRSPHDKVIALRSERARGDSVSSELRARVAEH
jgi:FlaA1/EpsC-like NDP-sugar epimerase